MRTLAPLALLALVVVTAFASVRLAGAEDPVPTAEQQQARRLEVLERQVAFLRSREAKHTAYMLKNADRADGLKRLVVDMRNNGFATAGNPSATRERFLMGLDALADSLKKDLPVATTQELQMLEGVR